jgi:hypothetical protein
MDAVPEKLQLWYPSCTVYSGLTGHNNYHSNSHDSFWGCWKASYPVQPLSLLIRHKTLTAYVIIITDQSCPVPGGQQPVNIPAQLDECFVRPCRAICSTDESSASIVFFWCSLSVESQLDTLHSHHSNSFTRHIRVQLSLHIMVFVFPIDYPLYQWRLRKCGISDTSWSEWFDMFFIISFCWKLLRLIDVSGLDQKP